MSRRALWKMPLEVNFDKRVSEVSVEMPPHAQVLEVRFHPEIEPFPAIWFVGDMHEPCVQRRFACVQTGEAIPQGYSFVGIVPYRGIMSFGLFVAG